MSSARVSVERPFYDQHADAYDRLITDPVEPWVDAVHVRIQMERAGQHRILDAGCGTGRHAAALTAKGHLVDLADASPRLLAHASERCPTARALLVDLCEMRLAPIYDAVTCRGVLNDMISDDERNSVINSLAAALRPGGLLFLDVREAQAARARADNTKRVALVDLSKGRRLRFTSCASWQSGLLRIDERYEILVNEDVQQDTTYQFVMRPWSRPELTARLQHHGFRDVRISGGVGRRTPDRLFVVASKTAPAPDD